MPEFQLITDHIARLELRFRAMELVSMPISVYLVRSQEGFALVDTGPPAMAGEVVEAVSRATQERGPKAILLTHAHRNHAGGLTALRLAWNPPIFAHPAEIPFIKGEKEYIRQPSKNPGYWLGSLLMEEIQWSIPVAEEIEQDQVLYGLSVIHLPGHTPGHIGFLHGRDRACICGDAVLNIGPRLSAPFILTTIDPRLAKRSIARLRACQCDSGGDPAARCSTAQRIRLRISRVALLVKVIAIMLSRGQSGCSSKR